MSKRRWNRYFYKKCYSFNVRNFCSTSFENLCVNLNVGNNKNLTVCAIYRPPIYNKNDFIVELSGLLQYFNNDDAIIVGDININTIDINTSTVKKYLDTINSYGYENKVTEHTRVDLCNNSYTLIDHLLVKSRLFTSSVKVIKCTILDHFVLNFMLTTKYLYSSNKHENANLTKINEIKLSNSLSAMNWLDIISPYSINEAMNQFCEQYNNVLQTCSISIHTKKYKPKNPWITSELVAKCKKRDYLFRLWKNNSSYEI